MWLIVHLHKRFKNKVSHHRWSHSSVQVWRELMAPLKSRHHQCAAFPRLVGHPYVSYDHVIGIKFYIRINLGGSFHTYPDVGGPFQSLQEAKNAIDRYLHDLRDPKMCLRGLSPVEMGVRQCLYWPDGTWKKQPIDKIRNWTHHLVQALVDKYNDDHNLLGDHAYELQEVVGFQPICEVDIFSWYYHINFTGKTKGDDCFVLFFAEVISTKAEHEELVLSCFCVLKPTDGGLCYGCRNNGSGSMKHPDNAAAYTGGHVKDAFLPFGASNKTEWIEYRADEEFQAAEEARIRRHYMGLADPAVLHRLRLLPLGAGPLDKAKVQEWMAMGAD